MSFDGDEHETRRNVLLGVGLSVLAVILVGGMFWVMSSLSRPVVTGTATAVKATTATDVATSAPAPTPTTTFVPPSGTWTNTATLPPAEQPTMTAPVAGQTVDATPAPPAPPKTTQAPAPTSAAPVPPAPAAPAVSNVNLTCSKDAGKRITAKLSFTTTTRIDLTLSAGGGIQRGQAGPGNVSVSASGRGAEICFAQIGGQMVGPIPAS